MSTKEDKAHAVDDHRSDLQNPGVSPLSENGALNPGCRRIVLISDLELPFRWCPPGIFIMGSPPKEPGRASNENQHKVTLARGFWMLETPVTQEMYQVVMDRNPSRFSPENDEDGMVDGMDTSRFPVESVTWQDAVSFCDSLTKYLGSNAEAVMLPTEAQWEYACRAGTVTAYNFGDRLCGREANCDGNLPCGTKTKGPDLRRPCPVGTWPANAWGLQDMHGNVNEWCLDRFDNYPTQPVVDFAGRVELVNIPRGNYKVIRGGSWANGAEYCRSAARGMESPEEEGRSAIGFRIVINSR